MWNWSPGSSKPIWGQLTSQAIPLLLTLKLPRPHCCLDTGSSFAKLGLFWVADPAALAESLPLCFHVLPLFLFSAEFWFIYCQCWYIANRRAVTQRITSSLVLHSSAKGSDPDAKLVRWGAWDKRIDPPILVLQMKLRQRLLFYRAPGNWMKFRSRVECFSAHHGRTITQLCPQEEYMTPLYLFAICLIDGRLHPAYSLQNFLASVLKFPLRFQCDVWRSRLPLVLFITATGLQKAGWQRTASSVSQWTVQAHMAGELQPNNH